MFNFDASIEDISLNSSNGQDQYHHVQRKCQRELSKRSPEHKKQDHAIPIANPDIAKSSEAIVSHHDHQRRGTYYFALLVSG